MQELSILGRGAHLSLTQRQKLRDRLFKQIGQLDLIDAMQTKTAAADLVMPVNRLASIFRPQRIMLGLPATVGLIVTVFIATFTTGALARDAAPGDPLFRVRKVIENVEIALTTDPARRATLRLAIADDRLKALSATGEAQLGTLRSLLRDVHADHLGSAGCTACRETDLRLRLAVARRPRQRQDVEVEACSRRRRPGAGRHPAGDRRRRLVHRRRLRGGQLWDSLFGRDW